MAKSEVLLYSRSKFNATAILYYKLIICKGKILYGIALYEIAILLTPFMKEYFNSFDDMIRLLYPGIYRKMFVD